eukprot:TRINITY_DN2843_c0_g1_i1.p1 TRINITY_DN2843_c0_g1~~TRINITY_DN2843_c0_g1_i1.p1  ORF type:complete len:1153 (+),score=402.17 TRINITY_DN2843_c0_g1_i1:227-3685(+)
MHELVRGKDGLPSTFPNMFESTLDDALLDGTPNFSDVHALADAWPAFQSACMGFVPINAEVLKSHFETHQDVMLQVLAEHPEISAKIIWPENVSMFVGFLLVDKSPAVSAIAAELQRLGQSVFSAKSAFQNMAFCEQMCRACPRDVATLLTANSELRGAFAQWHFDDFRELWLGDQAIFEPFPHMVPGIDTNDDASFNLSPSMSMSSPPSLVGTPDGSGQSPLLDVLSEMASLDPTTVSSALERIAAWVEPVDAASAAQLRDAVLIAIELHQPFMSLAEVGGRALDRLFLLEQQNAPNPSTASPFAPSSYSPALAVAPMSTSSGASDALLQQPPIGQFLSYEEKPSTVTIHPKRNFRCHQIGQANATRPFTCYFKLLLDGCRFDRSCRIVHVNDTRRPHELVFHVSNAPDVDVHLAITLLVSPDGSPGSWQQTEGLKLHRPPATEPPEAQRAEVKVRRGPKRVPPWKVEASTVPDPYGGARELSCARFEIKFAIIASSFTQTVKEPRQFKVRFSLLEHPAVMFECLPFLTAQRMPSSKQANSMNEMASAAALLSSEVFTTDMGRKKTKIEAGPLSPGVYHQTVNGVTEDLRPYPKLISPITHYAGDGSPAIAGHVIYQNVRRVEGGSVQLWDLGARPVRVFFATSPQHQPLLNPSIDVDRVDTDNGCIYVTIPPYPQPALFAVAVAYDQAPAVFNPKEEILFRYVDASWFREAFAQSATGFGSPSGFGQPGAFGSFGAFGAPNGSTGGSSFNPFAPPGGNPQGSQQSSGGQDVSQLADRMSAGLSVSSEAISQQHRATVSPAQLLTLRVLQYERELQQVAARYELRKLQRSGVFFGNVADVPPERLPPPSVFRGIIRSNWKYRLPRESSATLRRLLNAPFGPHGCRALHYCVLVGLPAIIEEMLWKGAEIDAPDALGRTALHIAAEQADFDAADVLINYGASRSARDRSGRTAAELLPARFLPVWLLSFGREPTHVPLPTSTPPPLPARPLASAPLAAAVAPRLPPRSAAVASRPAPAPAPSSEVVDEYQLALQLTPSDVEKVGYGPWTRQDSEANLAASPPGTFLLRWSANSRSYVLSYRDLQSMQIVHLQGIFVDRKRVRVDSGDGTSESYADMLEFIQHEQKAGNIGAPYPRYINRSTQLEQIRGSAEG